MNKVDLLTPRFEALFLANVCVRLKIRWTLKQ